MRNRRQGNVREEDSKAKDEEGEGEEEKKYDGPEMDIGLPPLV